MRAKRVFSLVLILLGTNLCTYSIVRATVTQNLVGSVTASTKQFLSTNGFEYGAPFPGDLSEEERVFAGRRLILLVSEAGGPKKWRNTSLFSIGLGMVMVVAGILIPFSHGVLSRRRVEGDSGQRFG